MLVIGTQEPLALAVIEAIQSGDLEGLRRLPHELWRRRVRLG